MDMCRPNGDKPGKENDAESASKRRSRSKERPGEERKRSGGDGGAARTKPRDSRRVIYCYLSIPYFFIHVQYAIIIIQCWQCTYMYY